MEPPPNIKMAMSQAAQDFSVSFADAKRLFELYDAEVKRSGPSASGGSEVLKRASLMIAVVAFENYVEDYLSETFPPRLANESSPAKFKEVFDIVAKKWLREHPDQPAAIAQWTGDGWKSLLSAHLAQRLKALNSPKSEVVIGLFRQFLGVDLSKVWVWQGYGFAAATKRLDEIVALRGRVAHFARKTGAQPVKHEVSRPDLKKFLTFLEGIVGATETAI